MAGILSADRIIESEKINQKIRSIGDEISKLIIAFDKVAESGNKISESLGKSSNLNDIVKINKDVAKSTDEITFSQAELAKQAQELARLNAKLENIQSNYNKEIIKTRSEINNQNLITKQQILQNNSLDGSYDKINATLNQTIRQYKALSQADRENEAIGGQMIKSIQAQDAQLKQLDATMGRNQRNVGNYKSGFNGLNFSILQVGRELPSLAYGFSTFIGAISNNIPMVTDEITKAKKELALLKEEGKVGIPIWKQLAGAIFSWQTAMVVSLTILTMYGREIANWAKELFKGKTALDQNKIAQDRLNEANKKGYEDGQKDLVRLKLLYNATKSNTISLDEKKKAIKELQDQYPDYLGKFSEEEILAGKASKAYYELANAIMASAKAKAYEQIIIENEVKKLELETKVLEERKGLLKAQNSLNKANKLFEAAAAIGTEEAMTGASSVVAAAQSNVDKFTKSINILNAEISAIEYSSKELAEGIKPTDLLSNLGQNKDGNLKKESNLIKSKFKLAKEAAEKELAEFKRTEQLKLAEQAKASNELIENDDALKSALEEQKYDSDQRIIDEEIRLQETLLKLTKDGSIERASVESEIAKLKEDIEQRSTDRTIELINDEIVARKKALAQQKKDKDDASKTLLSDTENNIIKEQTVLTKKAGEDIKNAKGNGKKTKEIKDNLVRDMLNVELMYRKDVAENERLIGDDKKKNADRIVDLQKTNEDQKLQKTEDVENAIFEVRQQTFNKSAELVNVGFDIINQSYQNQLSVAEEMYKSEVAAAGDNLEERIIAERKFENEKKKIARNQAIAQKAQAAFNIALSTAQAIIAIWANPITLLGAPALTAVVATLGAAQLAAALSQPIPAFFKGTENAPETFIAGDTPDGKGASEMIIKPSGEMLLTPSKATLFSDKSFIGSKILPHDKTNEMLANYAVNQGASVFVDMSGTNKYLNQIAQNTKNNEISGTDSRGRQFIKRGSVTTHY